MSLPRITPHPEPLRIRTQDPFRPIPLIRVSDLSDRPIGLEYRGVPVASVRFVPHWVDLTLTDGSSLSIPRTSGYEDMWIMSSMPHWIDLIQKTHKGGTPT